MMLSRKSSGLERFPLRLNRIPKAGGREESRGVIRLLGDADMAKPYSSDLRERVVEAVNEGAT